MSDTLVTALYDDDLRVVEVEERRLCGRRIRITVVGDLDRSTQEVLQSALDRAWGAAPAAVVLDLRPVTFLGAAGLRTLLVASSTARARGAQLVLQAGPGQVTRLLTMVGFRAPSGSAGEAGAVLAAGPGAPRPALRLVPSTDEPTSPVGAGPVPSHVPCAELRLVRTPDRGRPGATDEGRP